MAASDIPTEYPPATDEDFKKFMHACDSTENWRVCYESKDGTVKVWDQPSEKSSINLVKLYAEFPDVDALALYDTLHDADYRKEWDDKMIEGFNIEQIDANNDVGYYSAKAPMGVNNRDWCNERSWRVAADNKEYIIMNHSVIHAKCPEKKGCVRANSIMAGYFIRVREGGGCTISYIAQNDPRGWLPTWLVNTVTRTYAPQIVDKLRKAALDYNTWKEKHEPSKRPWRGMH